MEYIIIIAFVAGIVIGVMQLIHTSNMKKIMEEKLTNLENFSPSQKVMSNDGNTGIAIDEGRKKLCLIKQTLGDIDLDIMSYKDILQSVIYEDGVTITKSARGSRLGGALIGGVISGGVGAIIGGLSGKKISSDKVNRIDLQITVNRTDSPIHDINFMDVAGKKHGLIYNHAMEQARHWHGLLEVLIKRADSEDIKNEQNPTEKNVKIIPKGFIADELAKLAELQTRGLISNTEFRMQKTKLLA